jgi:hypothetical protein
METRAAHTIREVRLDVLDLAETPRSRA